MIEKNNNNMKELFSRSKEFCPELPCGTHKIARLVTKRMGDSVYVSPQKLSMIFADIIEKELIKDFELFPQMVDVLMEFKYSTTFRIICREVLEINTPPLVASTTKWPQKEVQIAVEWWTKTLLFRDTSKMPTAFQIRQKTYTVEEIQAFRYFLGLKIIEALAVDKEVWLSCNWTADGIIKEVGDMIGINQLWGYPDARMAIYEGEVRAYSCTKDIWETIYLSEEVKAKLLKAEFISED